MICRDPVCLAPRSVWRSQAPTKWFPIWREGVYPRNCLCVKPELEYAILADFEEFQMPCNWKLTGGQEVKFLTIWFINCECLHSGEKICRTKTKLAEGNLLKTRTLYISRLLVWFRDSCWHRTWRLFVNIVAPPSFKVPSQEKFPVRVFIHGGYVEAVCPSHASDSFTNIKIPPVRLSSWSSPASSIYCCSSVGSLGQCWVSSFCFRFSGLW